ncbi:MAG: hypothetical protein ACLFSQ_03620 [Candidatus Zixiibacteriota bacterium]
MSHFSEFDFSNMRRRSIKQRNSKVHISMFPQIPKEGQFRDIINYLPDILAGKALKQFASHIKRASQDGTMIIGMLGGHVIKCGLGPVLADMAKRGFIGALAGNGSIAIHDVEIALFGETSEAVENEIDEGLFGMTEETADFINSAQIDAAKLNLGLGEILGQRLSSAPHKEYSLLWQMHELGLPITVHPMLGAEVIHPHPSFDGKALGEVAHRDFRIFTHNVSKMKNGLIMNFGSAVIMPEIFIKALSAARNKGHDISGIIAANFDQIQHYRPTVNVLKRPTQANGEYFAFTGHHEIMIPLLAGLI